MDIAKEIGHKLKQARKDAGYTQKEMARLLGLSHVGYGAFERGRTLISLEYLLELPDILNKPITYFLPDAVVSEEERHDPLLDPRLQAVIAAWPDAPEYLKDLVADALQRAVGEKQEPSGHTSD